MATLLHYPLCPFSRSIRLALAECGVERDAIDYEVGGSSDYVDGRPFGFVAALDKLLERVKRQNKLVLNGWDDANGDDVPDSIAEVRRYLGQLPKDVAEQIAFKNAERLFP